MGFTRRAFIEPFSIHDRFALSIGPTMRTPVRAAIVNALFATGVWAPYSLYDARVEVELTSPISIGQRERAADMFYGLVSSQVDDFRAVRLVDWIMEPWLLAETADFATLSASIQSPISWIRGDPRWGKLKRGGNYDINVYDPIREAALDALRLPLLGPWLSGQRPVSNLETFTDFHLGLSTEERYVARCIWCWAHYGGGIPSGWAYGPWLSSVLASLTAGSWIETGVSKDRNRKPIYRPGPRLRRLAIGQGELLAG